MSASLAPECNEVKEYDDLNGTAGSQTKDKCDALFKDYQTCLKVALTAKGIDKLVEEAREDHKESDALYMNKKQ
ncbi:Mitochondrial distribution and morphology protein 35 [Sporothrix epigloea]|uniref:Mitochondrial distribution and morphology protein 35 n=1 Tax=Sporothrix epigloea TaxID=1892477 RepID=A0ABP0DEU7_9PEZI